MTVHFPQIAPHPRTDIGVRRRRRGALVLAVFLRQFVRSGDEQIRIGLFDDALGALFVCRIAVRVQERRVVEACETADAAEDLGSLRPPHRGLHELDGEVTCDGIDSGGAVGVGGSAPHERVVGG